MEDRISEINTLGGELRRIREQLRMNVDDVARGVQAPVGYIVALEQESYFDFPAKVYATGFLNKVLEFYSVSAGDRREMMDAFNRRWEVFYPPSSYHIRKSKFKIPVITLGRLSFAFGGLLFLSFFILSGSRILGFIFPPKLSIKEPADEIFLDKPVVAISGVTEKESRLSVNGREIKIDDAGAFSEEIELIRGLNTLDFLVQNRFGKTNEIVKHVVVKSST